jgi:uncharacterized membrane protein
MNITANTLNFHIIFKVNSVALIFFDAANCNQTSLQNMLITCKIVMLDTLHQSPVFVDENIEMRTIPTIYYYWERERERERDRRHTVFS